MFFLWGLLYLAHLLLQNLTVTGVVGDDLVNLTPIR